MRSRTPLVTTLIAVVATLGFAWATWALFLAPRDGRNSIEGTMERLAEELRAGNLDAVREHLDPTFTFDPGGLDRDAALAFVQAEISAGRFFPYVAHTHSIAGSDGEVERIAVLGILARGLPEKSRDVEVRPVRLELRIRAEGGRFVVVSATARLGGR